MGDNRSPQGPDHLEGVELLHALPGRVRLRFPWIKSQPDLAREIQKQLTGLKIIRRVEVSTITGSVLVLYDPADTPAMEELGRLAIPGLKLGGMSAPGVSPPDEAAANVSLSESIADYFRQLNAWVKEATGGPDLKALLPSSLFLCGIVRLLIGKRITSPNWYDFLWFAFGTFCTLNRTPSPGKAAPDHEAMPALAHGNGKLP